MMTTEMVCKRDQVAPCAQRRCTTAVPPAAAAASGKGKGKVGEPAEGVRQMEADEDFARQLQAKMDAEARGGGK